MPGNSKYLIVIGAMAIFSGYLFMSNVNKKLLLEEEFRVSEIKLTNNRRVIDNIISGFSVKPVYDLEEVKGVEVGNDQLNNTILLKDKLSKEYTLILNISESDCLDCVNETARLINERVENDPELANSILALADFGSLKNIYAWKITNDVDFDVINISNFKFENRGYFLGQNLSIFVLDKRGQIHNYFIPTKGMKSVTRKYLDQVIDDINRLNKVSV